MNFVILVGPKLNFVDKVKMHKEVCRIIFDEYLTKRSHDEETGSSKGGNVKCQFPTFLLKLISVYLILSPLVLLKIE